MFSQEDGSIVNFQYRLEIIYRFRIDDGFYSISLRIIFGWFRGWESLAKTVVQVCSKSTVSMETTELMQFCTEIRWVFCFLQ